jgi:hypothetical protein
VVHDEVDGHERLDEGGVAALADDFGAQAGEIDDAGDAGEVLEKDARGQVGDFLGSLRPGVPAGEGFHVPPFIGGVGLVAQDGFEEDADDIG